MQPDGRGEVLCADCADPHRGFSKERITGRKDPPSEKRGRSASGKEIGPPLADPFGRRVFRLDREEDHQPFSERRTQRRGHLWPERPSKTRFSQDQDGKNFFKWLLGPSGK